MAPHTVSSCEIHPRMAQASDVTLLISHNKNNYIVHRRTTENIKGRIIIRTNVHRE